MFCQSKSVLFSNTFSIDIQEHGKRFTLQNILSIRSNATGVYIFHYNRSFVYVGQSKSHHGIRERLINHYRGSHNEKLAVWVKALDGDVKFTYITCRDTEVDDLEKSLILYLQPITNVSRYPGYTPKHANWRKSYG